MTYWSEALRDDSKSDDVLVRFPASMERPEGYIKYFGPPKVEGALEIPIDKFPTDLLQELLNASHGMALKLEIDRLWLTGGISIHTSSDGTNVSLNFEASDITIKPSE